MGPPVRWAAPGRGQGRRGAPPEISPAAGLRDNRCVPSPRRALLEPADPRAGQAERGLRPISVRHLSKRFGPVTAVADLSFEAHPGRVTGFLGPNGAGKTTTLRMLVGLVTPTAGQATFGGTSFVELAHPQRAVGCVLEASFHPGRSGRNSLRVLADTAAVGPDRVDELLALVGLTEAARRPTGSYSLGMKQRLALAGALLGDPDYLVLDEPANGLDPEGIRWLRSFLRAYAARGRVVLVSSHLLAEVQATVDDVVVISHGRLLRQAAMRDLDLAQGAVRVRVPQPDRARDVLLALGLEVTVQSDDEGPFLRVRTGDNARVGAALFEAGLPVSELARERYDLEEQFFAMVEGQER